MLHLALFYEVLDCAGDVFNRNGRINAMLVKEFEGIDPKALK